MSLNSWSLNHHPLFLKLFIFGCAGSSLLHGLFSSRGKQGLLSSCGVWASHCGGFSRRAAWAHGLRSCSLQALGRLRSCGAQAQPLCGMRDLPRPGMEPVSPALAGRIFTTQPPGRPDCLSFNRSFSSQFLIQKSSSRASHEQL